MASAAATMLVILAATASSRTAADLDLDIDGPLLLQTSLQVNVRRGKKMPTAAVAKITTIDGSIGDVRETDPKQSNDGPARVPVTDLAPQVFDAVAVYDAMAKGTTLGDVEKVDAEMATAFPLPLKGPAARAGSVTDAGGDLLPLLAVGPRERRRSTEAGGSHAEASAARTRLTASSGTWVGVAALVLLLAVAVVVAFYNLPCCCCGIRMKPKSPAEQAERLMAWQSGLTSALDRSKAENGKASRRDKSKEETHSNLFGGLVKHVVETWDEVIGVEISVGSMDIDALHGKVKVSELVVHNPEGYCAEHLLHAGKVTVDIDLKALVTSMGKRVVVTELLLEDVNICYQRACCTSNLQDLLDHISKTKASKALDADGDGALSLGDLKKRFGASTKQMSIVMRKVTTTGISVHSTAYCIGGIGLRLAMGDIMYKDFEKEHGGVNTLQTIIPLLLSTIIKSALATMLTPVSNAVVTASGIARGSKA